MLFSRPFFFLLLGGGLAYASSLSVYQDKILYKTALKNNYIGFTQGIQAKCQERNIPLSHLNICPPDDRLCKLFTSLKKSEQKLRAVQSNIKVLNQLISLPEPTTFDADNWIEAAKKIGQEQAELSERENLLMQDVSKMKSDLKKQAPTKQALQASKQCEEETELTLPYGYVTFSANYEADIEDEKEITVTQNISIINRSGIDIVAENVMFYYRSAHQYLNPIHFNPWIVSKYLPHPAKRMYKTLKNKISADTAMLAEENMASGGDIVSVAAAAIYEDARRYKIEGLTLPSTGEPLEVKVLQWKADVNCEVHAYPYMNSKAFHICSFKPKFQIDSNRWKIKEGGKLLNENGAGEYDGGDYKLYTRFDEDIKIVRRPIVKKEHETGIFGGTARKKDGFTLTLTNKSDKTKTLTVTDRIPTSTTDEIKVKLLKISSDKKVGYKMLKEGKIEMKLVLNAQETKKIEVLFEISYDKELKVSY